MADVINIPRGFTEAEAAEILTKNGWSITPETLRKHRRNGKISFRKIGGLVRYTAADLERFVNQGTVECRDSDKTDSKSVTTGSQSRKTAQAGTQHGSMQNLDMCAAKALMSQI